MYYDGTVADPDFDYTYDALYRLIIAQGREHEGNNSAVTHDDSSRIMTPAEPVSATDTAKMRRYTQKHISSA